MNRIPEDSPLMTGLEQCMAYNNSLHSHEFNDYICWYEKYVGVSAGTIVDLGSGTCNFVIALCLKYPDLKVVCYEDSETMIDIANKNINRENLSDRITTIKDNLMNATGRYDAVLLNRVLHHIDDTNSLWKLVNSLSDKVLAVDLKRHDDPTMLTRFIEKIKNLFDPLYVLDTNNSFKAAYSHAEVLEQIKPYNYIVEIIDTTFDDVAYGKLIIHHTR